MCRLQYYFAVNGGKTKKIWICTLVRYSLKKTYACFVVRKPFRRMRTTSNPPLIAKYIRACLETPSSRDPRRTIHEKKKIKTIHQVEDTWDTRKMISDDRKYDCARERERKRDSEAAWKEHTHSHVQVHAFEHTYSHSHIYIHTHWHVHTYPCTRTHVNGIEKHCHIGCK